MNKNRERCRNCDRPAALIPTRAGNRCKRCVSRLPSHLRGDPSQPKPNADRGHRIGKESGASSLAVVQRRSRFPDRAARKRIGRAS